MKWQAIANVTGQINEEAKACLARKIEKDAQVQLPHLWSDFITETNRHLAGSQSNLNVRSDAKTGNLTCLTEFDDLHPDFLENNKPFLKYALDKYDQRAAGYLTSSAAKNPLTRSLLQQKISNYRMHLAEQITHTESKLIDGKRTNLAIESIAKLKNSTYDQPILYQEHLQQAIGAISALSLFPMEKEKMVMHARSELAEAAALGTVKQSPHLVLNNDPQALPPWKADLTLEQRIKIEHQASNLLHHQQEIRQKQVLQLSKTHLTGILKTGSGIAGFDNTLRASFSQNDPMYLQIKQNEELYKQAFLISEQMRVMSLSESAAMLKQIEPKVRDAESYDDYVQADYEQKVKIHNILAKQLNEQIKEAERDPAKLVEDLFSPELSGDISPEERYLLRKTLQSQKGISFHKQRYLMNNERNDFLEKLQLPDAREIKKQLDVISSIGSSGNNTNNSTESTLGTEILHEILESEPGEGGRRLSALSYLYVQSYLNKNENLMHDLTKAIAMQGQLFGEFANHDKSAIEKTIKNSKTVEDFEYSMLSSTPDNALRIDQLKTCILSLARFYQRDKNLDPKKATNIAINELISKSYIKAADNLYIPKTIIEDGEVKEVEADYVNYYLSKLRADLINGNVNLNPNSNLNPNLAYDRRHSFGEEYTDQRQSVLDSRIRELLRDGQFKLTSDQKHIYFVYFDNDGVYNLLKSDGTLWSVPLSALNVPVEQKDVDMDNIYHLLQNNPVILGH